MSPPELLNAIDVLLVEDDPGDSLMTREAFADNKVAQRARVRRATAWRRWRTCAERASTRAPRART